MDIRILEPEEYRLLDAIPAPDAIKLDPDRTLVAAAIDEDGKIKGRMVLVDLPHLEFIWIDPEQRKTIQGDKILLGMENLLLDKLKSFGAGMVLAFTVNETMEAICSSHGYTKFASAWRKDI